MIRTDQFLVKMKDVIRQQDALMGRSLQGFLDDIAHRRVYIPSSEDNIPIEYLLTDTQRSVVAYYYVARVEINGLPKRITSTSAFPGPLSAQDFDLLQMFIEELRQSVSNGHTLEPGMILLPCPAQAMLLVTTPIRKKIGHPEFFLLLHESLEPFAGLELIYSSMMHWRDTEPNNPLTFGIQPIQ